MQRQPAGLRVVPRGGDGHSAKAAQAGSAAARSTAPTSHARTPSVCPSAIKLATRPAGSWWAWKRLLGPLVPNGLDVERIEGLAGGHEQAVPLGAAEA